ncbi:two-component regulator propeller domain-containing protein [Pontibacter silvestris]|uniref:Two-component regulator propeller domain-containing protein n=1 Tax=Pontibacter silvestris TaxID=2305183 RepID=A0ABW4WZH3_9BACT|nr:two-component regulator propeller domain-containing protein [Pontibacter silvestris]MCC9137620.1 hypothetical protein [Pontibacter silvestris]
MQHSFFKTLICPGLIFWLYCWLSPAPVSAQQYNFRSWTLEQGLPQSQINDILQDNKRQLWLATRGGLSRFNGSTFQTYTKQQGLSSNNIACLYQDSRRHIWIGTSDRGLIEYDNDEFKIFNTKNGLPRGGVSDIVEDEKGHLWVTTARGVYYSSSKGQFVKYNALPEHNYTTLAFSPTGQLWVGSKENGLYKIEDDKVVNITTRNSDLPIDEILTISHDAKGTLWIGTTDGVATVKQQQLTEFKLPYTHFSPRVTNFTHDNYGNTWIALYQHGLLQYNGKEFTLLTRLNGLRTNRISTLTTDKEGNIWIGTDGYGLQQYKAPWFVHYFDFGTVSEPRVSALAQGNNGKVWLGTDDGHAAHLVDGQLQWMQKRPWPEGTTLNDMWVKSEKVMWVCTNRGVWYISPDSVRHYNQQSGLASNEVYQCSPDSAGNVWFATANGASRFSKGKFTNMAVTEDSSPKRVYCIFNDSHNKLWFGLENGVYQVNNSKLEPVLELQHFNIDEVTSIAEDEKGVMYFGGFNYGLVVLNKAWQRPKLFTAANGLPNEDIKSLFVDKTNNLWVGTTRNVIKVELEYLLKTGGINSQVYTSQNGFSGMEVSSNTITQTPDGYVWFGTAKGLTKYIPKLDRRNKVYPQLMLNNILLFLKPTNWQSLGYNVNKETGLPRDLKLTHSQNHVTFDFFGINLSDPERVRYKYRLKGYDEQWSHATDKTLATYARLSPGIYTFELLAQNNDGYWTPKPLTYTFSIVPPIWRREWFIGVLLLIVGGSVISVVRLRERSLVKLNSLLEMRVQHRTRLLERKNREKEMLLQEIHHRVKNNLQIVISMLNLQARHVHDQEALEVMRSVRSRVRSMAVLHERLYQHDDLAHIDLEDYFRVICEGLYAAYGVTEENIKLELEVPTIKVDIDSAITLGLIVNELVSNTLKYAFQTKQNGILRIMLEEQGYNTYSLTVSDNGKGIPEGINLENSQSFGLKLVTSLSKKLSGRIAFNNHYGTKSTLHFVLPS